MTAFVPSQRCAARCVCCPFPRRAHRLINAWHLVVTWKNAPALPHDVNCTQPCVVSNSGRAVGVGTQTVTNADTVADEQTPYEQLYHEHYARVMRLCRLLLEDPHEAQDVAQDVFLKLLQAHHTETRTMAWGPWLTRVAVNACRDRRRSGWWKWWRAPRALPQGDDIPAMARLGQGPTPEEEALSREVRERIWLAFRELPPRQQEIFVLRYLEGWAVGAIAEALELSAGSVKQHLFRAVHRLRRTIGGKS
jgi:RNA polymerase sigma-70 factor (ECF subfamily)